MRIRISLQGGVPVYLQIANQIKYLAASRRFLPGDQLPSVRKLAEELVINPNTVARAYRELENEGVLVTRRGAGVYVSEGGSPLAKKERRRILSERIDMLLTEAGHLNVNLEDLMDLIGERNKILKEKEKKS
ncbi:GntR family transcriptional regulator [Candidatus Sumerlaeota bacterium]|nr:GntR family transcriptional regulator [Candidatus Sumerlaeota bacterium]